MSIFYQRCNTSFPKKIDIRMPPEDLAQLRSPPTNTDHAYRRAGDGSGAVFVDDRSSFFNNPSSPEMQIMVEAWDLAKQQWKQECPCISQMIDTIPMTISRHNAPGTEEPRKGVVAFVAPYQPLEVNTCEGVIQEFLDVGINNNVLREYYHSVFYHEIAHIFGICIPCWDASKIERHKALQEITRAKDFIGIQIKAATSPSRYVDNLFDEYTLKEFRKMFPTMEQKHKEFWELYNSDPNKYPQVAENEKWKKDLADAGISESGVARMDQSAFTGRVFRMRDIIPNDVRDSPRVIANYLIRSILFITSDQDDHTLIYLRQFLCNNNGAKSFIATILKRLVNQSEHASSVQEHIESHLNKYFENLEGFTIPEPFNKPGLLNTYFPGVYDWVIMFNPAIPPNLQDDDVIRMLNEGTWGPAVSVAKNNARLFYEHIISFDSLEEYMFKPLAEIFDNIFKNTPFDKSKVCSFFDNIYSCDNLQPELRLQFDLEFRETKSTIWNGPTEWDILARPQSGSNSLGCCVEEKTWERWLFGPPDYGYFKIGELILCESCPGKCSFMWRPPELFDREFIRYRRNILTNTFISTIIFGCTMSAKGKGDSGSNAAVFEDDSDYGYNQDIINKLQDQLLNEVFQAIKASLDTVNAYLTRGVDCNELKGKKADYGEL